MLISLTYDSLFGFILSDGPMTFHPSPSVKHETVGKPDFVKKLHHFEISDPILNCFQECYLRFWVDKLGC